ncbi:hypothetical protein [Agrobacterium tumefaciens]|uniref:Tail assembly chaperone n=1 Tax=Agrobacterium tumefaciens TaxID=358 RepID=A0AB36ENQ1_AGRTU|nr:hypothetical protein A6U91_02530 [Agrobacterium tumefaciens]
MTYKRPAYEEVTIAHGENTVTLRPTLRAATILEDKFGLATIDKGLAELDFAIVSEIIRAASSSAQDAAAFLRSEAAGRPLSPFFDAVVEPLREIVLMFAPAPVQRLHKAQPATGERMTFTEMLAALYDTATGFLEWSPERAWTATPTEITRAHAAYIDRLVMTGVLSRPDKPISKTAPDADLDERLKADGLDPEFDRAALRALKAKIAR